MIKVNKIIPGGQALGVAEDGRKIFFWNALPDEIISEFQITKKKSYYYEAIATKIEQPSPYRCEPKDSCFLSTSPWQIVNFDYELKLKQELVVEIFREHHIDISTPDIFTDGKDYFYRNKMEYSLYWDHEYQKIRPAFHIRGSHRKLPIETSSIERPEIFQAALKIIDDLNKRHEEARKYQSILLRCNQSGSISGGLFINRQPHPVFDNLTDQLIGRSYSYSPNGFFQINLPVYELALKYIQKHVKTDKVLDLYAGVGTIGLSVVDDQKLILVECDKSAYRELEKNAKSHPNATTKLIKSEEALDFVAPGSTVILDPPRAGCDKKLLNKLLEVHPEKIIYLSCNPATQARDTKLLLKKYHIEDIKTFNFFPHTPHIENLVILSL